MDTPPRPSETGVQFGILGPLSIVVDGHEVALDSPKQRSLLVALLVEAGSAVATDRLAEIVWGEDQPVDPSSTIQTHVSRLRGLLEEWCGESARELLVTRPTGYALAVHPDQVDARRFERLVEEARGAATPEATVELLGAALALWRGRPFVELDHEQADAEATRLQELRLAALELRADAMLRLARHGEVVAELEVPVARNPLREHLRGLLMVALYRNGRQVDALAAYRDLRDQLVGELGLEPSAPLRQLELAILQQAEELPWPAPPVVPDASDERAGATRHSSSAATAMLPEPLTSFVGREEDIRGVSAALRGGRIVVLTGVGGVGKSRLAMRVAREVADDYADGVRVCDLSGADRSEAVAEIVATALGVLPTEGAGPAEGLVELLRAKHLLLVLDNCEHVAAGASALADRVGRTCPAVDVLVTSRQPLGVAGRQIWPVAPLDVGEDENSAAVAVFCDRASAADPSFELAGTDRDAVVEICRRLDGLPLALELAAARVRSMGPADIAARLDQRFDLLTAEPPEVAPRHRSLQTVVDWSYALLPEAAQQLFDRLAVFAGGFELYAAERVCAGDGLAEWEIAGRVAELVDSSLVAIERSRHRVRYRLLETLRDHGVARLDARGELATWQRRHAEHFASLAEDAMVGLQGAEEGEWMRAIDVELANLRAAQAWAGTHGQVDLALRLPALLCDYAYYQLRDEVYGWVLRALELPGASQSPAWGAALVAAGVGCMQRGQLGKAHEHGERALAAASDEWVVLRAVQLLAEISLYRGHLDETDRRGTQLVEAARSVDSAYYESLGQLYRVFAATYTGRADDAAAQLREGWQVVERARTPSLRAGYCYLEGEIRLDADPGAALAAFEQASEVAASVGNRFIEGVARVSIASLEARHGEPGEALAAFSEIIAHWRSSGDWAHMWTTLRNLLVLLERVAANEPAAVLLGAVETAGTGALAFGTDAQRLETTASSLRESLGREAFAAAANRGRNMSDDEAVAYALDEIDRLVAEGVVDGS
ncbi:MAG: BTAD domain-containing putative transcriptional regulator [Acidimicrobiales bacterium]|nr:BTAD domain-containing putative transcriptional regulator [Acidimicrobiales bacterium]